MKHGKWAMRAAAFLLSMVLMAGLAPAHLTAKAEDVDEQALQDLNSQYEALEKEQKKIQAEIDKAKTEKDKQLAVKKQIDNQIYLTRQQINVLNSRIGLLEETIAEHELLIEEKEREIEVKYDTFKKRMRASYMAGSASTLGLLLGADSFSEFLTRAEITSRIAEHDQQLIDSLNTDLVVMEEAKEAIAEDVKDIEKSKGVVAEKQQTLNQQLSTVNDQIQDIAALEAQIKKDKNKLDKQMQQVQSEIDKIYAANESPGEYNGGVMTWPVPGYPNVTSNYGWRFNGTNFHTGIDISGMNVHGKDIVAAASGTVIHVQQTFTPGRGYGRYLIVDHGGGISTLYGHTSQIVVKVGDKVSRGQTIAKVGTTGWSTGPHLHFEVRVGGKHQNPWGYLK